MILPLEADLRGHRVGGKAAHLARLLNVPGIRIPPSVVVEADALQAFVRHSFTEAAWDALIRGYQQGRRAPLFAELAHSPLPPRLLAELHDRLPPGPLLMVRSSGLAEDAATASLAGHFESVAARRTPESLAVALKKCWLVALRVMLDELAGSHPDLLRSMALVVQPVQPARQSGVYFTHSPLHAGRSMLVANWGSCHSVVAGTVATDRWLLKGAAVDDALIRYKFEMTVMDAEERLPGETVPTACGPTAVHQVLASHVYEMRVPPPLDGEPCVDSAQRARVMEAGARLRRHLGRPIDMEWSFVDGELVVLQARPITTRARRRRAPWSADAYQVASPGVARGPVRIIGSPHQLDEVQPGDILAVVATDPDYMPMLYRAGGLLSEEGSPLSHTAIVARELRIPCLLGVPQDSLQNGEVITVDAHHGLIKRRAAEAVPAPAERPIELFHQVSHLRWAAHRPRAALTVSALLAGWPGGSLAAYRTALEHRYRIGQLDMVLDLHDLETVPSEARPDLAALIRDVL